MTVYSVDCYYPDGLDFEPPFTAEGCFVDSDSNRILPDGETQSPMSSVVRALVIITRSTECHEENPYPTCCAVFNMNGTASSGRRHRSCHKDR